MDKLFVNFLPPWVETNIQPAFYDKESGAVLQQTARMYAKVNCLVRMFNKLSKETKETVEEYIAKFVELKDFVDTYFENLDVQEEINNKLDDMVEAGTLQEIITTYIQSNVAWTFDTVSEMQSATNLMVGSYAQTLGYNTIGDGGGATYKIVDTADTYTITISTGLYAKLVVTGNAICPQQFGAYGDGQHDDYVAVNKCVAFANDIVTTNGKFSQGEPEIELFGNYKITSGVILSPYLTYHLKGDVTFTSYLDSGKAVSIEYDTILSDNTGQNTSNGWSRGDMFYGGNLFITNSENTIKSGVIGLTINNDANLSETAQSFSRGSMRNISVTYFETGVKINCYHFYLQSFYNIVSHSNGIDLMIGTEGVTNVDSGENILFQNCLFGTCTDYGVTINVATLNIAFNSCSFDYNTKGAIRLFKQASIKLDSCHIEDCHAGGDIAGIIGAVSDSVYGNVKLNNVRFVNAHTTSPLIDGKHLTVTIDGLYESNLSNITNPTDKNNFYLTNTSIISNSVNNGSNLRMTAPKMNGYRFLNLSNETAGTAVVSGGTTVFCKYNYANANTVMSIEEVSSENVLRISATDSQLFNGAVTLDYVIPVDSPYHRISASYLYKFSEGTVEPRLTFIYYDENDTQISTKQWSGTGTNMLAPTSGEWCKQVTIPFVEDLPSNIKSVKVRVTFIARSYCASIDVKDFCVEVR